VVKTIAFIVTENLQRFFLKIPNMGIIIPNMGTQNRKKTGLGEALFSKTQRQVLGLLFGNPDRSFYANEIVRHAGVGIGTVQRELEKLSGAAILTTEKIGNQKHYRANHESPIFEELYGIVLKTFGASEVLRKAMLELTEDIDTAFIYGSVAKGTDHASSDIDIMIVSEKLTYPDIMSALTEVESKLGRTVNPTLYKPEEFSKRIHTDSSFVKRVLEQPKIFLIGTEDDIQKTR
jgi:predicted nucleotidyltransferase